MSSKNDSGACDAAAVEASFREMIRRFPYSVQMLAPDGTTIAVNHAYERLWGHGIEHLAGFDIRADPQLEPILDLLERGFAGSSATQLRRPAPSTAQHGRGVDRSTRQRRH